MFNFIATIILALTTTIGGMVFTYNFVPQDALTITGSPKLGATITTIQGSDTLSSSRSVINTNFSNLNSGKFELSDWYATTSAAQITTLAGLTSATSLTSIGNITALTATAFTVTNASSTILSSYLSYLGGTATTTIGTNGRVSVTGASTTPQRDIVVKTSASVECNLTDGATITFDLSTCNQGKVVLGGNRTLDFTNELQALGQGIRFIACQDGTGSRLITWDSAIRWAGGTAPTLTTTANKCDVIAGFTTAATGTTVILLDKSLNF